VSPTGQRPWLPAVSSPPPPRPFISLCAVAAGQDAKVVLPVASTCSTSGNYTDSSQYQRNLAELLSRLPVATGDNGWYYNGTAGTGADRVFGLVMCYADRNATQCRECLAGAPAGIATVVCPGSRNVSAAYEACVLRYANTDFFATASAADYDPSAAYGPVCFRFSEPRFSENQDSEISLLLEESLVE